MGYPDGGGLSAQGPLIARLVNLAVEKRTVPPVNSAPVKPTLPPVNSAMLKRTVPSYTKTTGTGHPTSTAYPRFMPGYPTGSVIEPQRSDVVGVVVCFLAAS